MLSVLFVTAALGYGIGGSEKALIDLLNNINTEKYDITVLSLNPAPPKRFSSDKIKIIYGYDPYLRMITPFRSVLKDLKDYTREEIKAKLKVAFITRIKKKSTSGDLWDLESPFIESFNKRFDLAIGYGLGVATFFASDKVSAMRKILWMDSDLNASGLDLEYCKKYYVSADAVAVVDKSHIKQMESIYPEIEGKVFEIRNIIPVDEIKRKAAEKISFNVNGGVSILSVGRLTKGKNYELALKAAKILKDRGVDFVWNIIGFGPEEKHLKKIINQWGLQSFVNLLGQILNPYPYYAASDLFVHTSIYEGSPLVLEEAMLFNIPIVTTGFASAANVINNGNSGFIVSFDENDLADRLYELIKNKELKNKISDYQSKNPIDYSKNLLELDELILKLMSRKKNPSNS